MRILAGACLILGCAQLSVAEIHSVDASAGVEEPGTGYIKVQHNVAPNGDTLNVNYRYFTRNGEPWMPVMGEFQFARYPHDEWDEELEKMKASGIDIIATCLFWNYHEETAGDFNWSGDTDLRRFVELAEGHGLKVWLRIGPWIHGEVRYGGIPDWVVRLMPTRSSDPVYLRYVERYFAEMAGQLEGLFWKDGGPIVGIQLDNEYNLRGHLQGARHMTDLKTIAQRVGFLAPFYSVTGWDNAVYPQHEFIPVWGNYADWPWAATLERQPPRDSYGFIFGRSYDEGDMGAQTQSIEIGDGIRDVPFVPYVGAEFGTGVPSMYWRRSLISPDDGAAILPTYLGSGVNLYGYYVFHGGRNPIGKTTKQGTTKLGDYVDNPIINYDFQAALSQYGEPHGALERIRPVHYMMHDFGDQLATTTVRKPDVTPDSHADLKTLRWSVRSNGDEGFLFVNNHVRHYGMQRQEDVQFEVKLPGDTLVLPSSPVTIENGSYFIWPVGMDLDGSRLDWATAQPILRLDDGAGPIYVFAAVDGIATEFAFPEGTSVKGEQSRAEDGRVVASVITPGLEALFTVDDEVRILVLTQHQGRRTTKATFAGQDHIVVSDDDLVRTQGRLHLTSTGNPQFEFSVLPALPQSAVSSLKLQTVARTSGFATYTAEAKARQIGLKLETIREAREISPAFINPRTKFAFEPYPEWFGTSAAWKLDLDSDMFEGLENAFLDIEWDGDIARFFANEDLIDDAYFNGSNWRIGLARFREAIEKDAEFTLTVLPLRKDAPIYIDETVAPDFGDDEQIAKVHKIKLEPQYRLNIEPGSEAETESND